MIALVSTLGNIVSWWLLNESLWQNYTESCSLFENNIVENLMMIRIRFQLTELVYMNSLFVDFGESSKLVIQNNVQWFIYIFPSLGHHRMLSCSISWCLLGSIQCFDGVKCYLFWTCFIITWREIGIWTWYGDLIVIYPKYYNTAIWQSEPFTYTQEWS